MFRVLMFCWILFIVHPVMALDLEGTVQDSLTHKTLSRVNITVQETETGTITNSKGQFYLENLPSDSIHLIISHIGYQKQILTVHPQNLESLSIKLFPRVIGTEEITVTSTRYEKTLQNVAMPISIIRSERIEQMAPTTIADALQREPGIHLARDGIWGTHVSIRGLSRSNIVTLVDGNRIDTATDLAAGMSMIDIYDIERTEVIKGSASSLYGSGAIGGVVNILTKDGWYGKEFFTSVRTLTGFNSVNQALVGHGSFVMGDNNWYARISASHRDAKDAETPQGTLENSQFRDHNLSARFGVKFSPKVELKFNGQRFRAFNVGIPGGYPLFPDQATVKYPTEERDLYSLTLNIGQLSSNLVKLQTRVFFQNIFRDVENIPHITRTLTGPDGQPVRRININRVHPFATHETLGAQVQSEWLFSGHHIIAGFDTWRKELDSQRTRDLSIDVLGSTGEPVKTIHQIIGERPLPLASYQSIGSFIHDEWALLGNRLSLSLGGRYDVINTKNETVRDPDYIIVDGSRNDSPASQEILWSASNQQDRSWSGNIGLIYRFTEKVNMTTTLARSFRSPYLEERYAYIDLGNLVRIGDPDLQPENGRFFDVGLKYNSDKLFASLHTFYNRLENLVTEMPGQFEGRPALIKTNIGKAELTGFEARAEWAIKRDKSLLFNMSYVRGTDLLSDTPLPTIPPLQANIALQGYLSSWAQFQIWLQMAATQDRIVENEFRTPGYTTVDVNIKSRQIKLADLNMVLVFGIENVLDRDYRNHLASNRGQITIEPGRNFITQMQLQW
ncbi:TonB-dependent receptor [candidate division KSB1 bacterium]|nr:TonB-dependent receptor [candidate division KSB1 bacterium]